jgi:rhomboid protease GluP
VASRSRVCPWCGKLNAAEDVKCDRCERRLPSPWQSAVGRGWASVFERRPWATHLFMLLSVGIYLALVLGGGSLWGPPRRIDAIRWGALFGPLGVIEPWRYLSAMFVHFSLLHVGFNTLTLHSIGRNLEEGIGSARFVLGFLGTGIAGFVASQLLSEPYSLTGGISGGIFGLLGVAVGFRYAHRDPEWKRLAITAVGYAVAMILLDRMVQLNVNHAAHIGGLVAGVGFGWVIVRAGRERRLNRATEVAAALLIVATFASIALSLTSPYVRRAPATSIPA